MTLRTSKFAESAHVGQLHDHTHRMGFLLALRESGSQARTAGE
jgi:hypothetical protein